MSEKDWISQYFAPLATSENAAGLSDDVARISGDGVQIVTQDALVETVHFKPADPIAAVARKLVRVNVSDILAKGARPHQALLTLGWPRSRSERELAEFARAFGNELDVWNIALIGGDTVTAPSEMFFSLTLTGLCIGETPVQRSGARVGDDVWVTGVIGAAKRGFDGEPDWLSSYQEPTLPDARIAEIVAGFAHASMDISDGLLGDAAALGAASNVLVNLDLERVPFAGDPSETAEKLALSTWGDDYQTLFTSGPDSHVNIATAARKYGLNIAKIGDIQAGTGLRVSAKGARINLPETIGFEHG